MRKLACAFESGSMVKFMNNPGYKPLKRELRLSMSLRFIGRRSYPFTGLLGLPNLRPSWLKFMNNAGSKEPPAFHFAFFTLHFIFFILQYKTPRLRAETSG